MADNRLRGNANKIQRCRTQLVSDINDVELEAILDHFFAKKLISTEEMHTVQAEKVIEKKNRCFLDILLRKIKRDDKSNKSERFDEFVACLTENDLNPIVAYLETADSSPMVIYDINNILEKANGLNLEEDLLGSLLRSVGSGWEAVAIQLGVTLATISQLNDSSNGGYVLRFKVFNSWVKKEGFKSGGLEKLLKALDDYSDDCDVCHVDWSKILKTIEKFKKRQTQMR